jgi:hypothetical protein
MQKNRKTRTQSTGNNENSVEDIKSETGQTSGKDDSANTGVAAPKKGKKTNAGNEIKADIQEVKNETKSKKSASRSKKSTNTNAGTIDVGNGQIDVGSGQIENSPGYTNVETSPGLPDAFGNLATADREAIIASVDADAERQTGRPTGAIYGSGGDIISVQNPAVPGEAAPEMEAYTKVYGLIQTSGDAVFLSQGSVPEGQLRLIGQAGSQEFKDQLSGYNEEFVTVLGEYQPQGDVNKAAFAVRSIASHNEIARRAYELSTAGNNSSEDNWIRAENDLLQQS